MPEQTVTKQQHLRLTLNTDGRTHPRENSLAVAAIVFGVVAFALGWIHPAHFAAAAIGLIGIPLGLYSQMVSATTGERWLNIIGLIGSAVGFALAVAHGGFAT